MCIRDSVTGDFSFKHLCSIHKHLFSDVYSWAGKTRTVDISTGTVFCLVQFIESQFDDLYRKLKKENFLADITDKEEMSERLALSLIHILLSGVDYRDMEKRLAPIASLLGIEKLLNKYPYEVSGGQKPVSYTHL